MPYSMNKAQRIVVILYCLSLAYCCVWIPWRVPYNRAATAYERAGYGWIWAGPHRSPPIDWASYADTSAHPTKTSSGLTVLGEVDIYDPPRSDDPISEPDLRLMSLRFIAATALSATLFLLAGLWKSATLS
jgi:hypothetical protein